MAEPWLGAFLDEDASVLEVPHACATILNPNLVYGHFLLEMLPRLHLLGVLRSLGIDFPLLLPLQTPAWVIAFILLYVKEDEIIWYNSSKERVQSPMVVLPSMMHRAYDFHPGVSLMAEDVKARAGVPHVKPAPFRRLYLSRRRLRNPGWHSLLNEAAVEQVFQDSGFEILHPQEMTIGEQLAAYDDAEVLGGEYGSAMHNAVFCRQRAKILVINEINRVQEKIATLRNQVLKVVPPEDGKFRTWETHVDDGMYTVDLPVLRAALKELLCQ